MSLSKKAKSDQMYLICDRNIKPDADLDAELSYQLYGRTKIIKTNNIEFLTNS